MKSRCLNSKTNYGEFSSYAYFPIIKYYSNAINTRTFECMVFAVQKDTDTAWKFNKLRDVNVKSTVKLRHPKSDVVFGNSIASSTKVSTLNEAKVDGKLTFVVELIEI